VKHSYFKWRYWVIGFFWSLLLLFSFPAMAHATDITLSGSQNADLSANLSWSLSNNTNNADYSYQLQQTDLNTNKISTIGTKDSIKVLNISPWSTSATQYSSLKTWIESTGYGKGKISVDVTTLGQFNSDPDSYLKDNGKYKYDVIAFGFADANGTWSSNGDISAAALSSVKSYLGTGRGVLLGHDTASLYFQHPNFAALGQDYLKLQISGKTPTYGDNKIVISKNGFLTNYPWNLGPVGTILNIPMTHSYGQISNINNVWMKFNSNTWVPGAHEPSGGQETSTTTNEWYLSALNNIAMIQTGHSNGQATSDEQKLIANTLFYLGQVTSATNFTTHTSQDVSAPDTPTMNTSYDAGKHTVTLSNLTSEDHGNKYSYQVLGTNLNDNSVVKSNVFSIECKTGVKKYVYRFDNNKNGTVNPASDPEVSNGQALTLPQSNQNYYLHVAAIDGNNNVSGSSSYFIDGTSPVLNNSDDLQTVTHSSEKLTVTATDADSGIDSIQTPDGTWHSGNSVTYQVDKNGTYAFNAKDKAGNTATKSITVANIYPETFVQNADKTQVADQAQSQTASFSDSVALNGTQQAINAASSDWLVGNSSGSGWLLSVSAPALSNGTHKLSNALSMKAPAYSGGNLHNLLGNDYQPLSDDASAVSVYQNKPTTFTWTHNTGTWYLRVNSYVKDQRYSVSNVRLTEQGSTTNLLQNSDGPFTPDSSSLNKNDPNSVDNYTYYSQVTAHLEQGKTYTLSAQSNGVIGADHYKYLTDSSNTNNHTVLWLASAPTPVNDDNVIVSDDDTNSSATSKLQLNDGSTYQVKVPANAYAGTYTTQIKWSVK
jgi:hypothetical protein